MKLRQLPLPVSLFLLHFLTHAAANFDPPPTHPIDKFTHVSDRADGKPGIDVTSDSTSSAASRLATSVYLGTKDAPYDGKDGRPHAGPFVETAAERDRKMAKDSDDDVPTTGKKPSSKGLAGSSNVDETWPESNDGVMDDPNRILPKEGTRGTEGGISEKSRDRKAHDALDGSPSDITPEMPKEAPPLPHSEEEILSSKESTKASKAKEEEEDVIGGLTKPEDLPDSPHDIPYPVGGSKEDALEISTPLGSGGSYTPESSSLIQPLHSFVLSFTMIIFSEIGDKTFLIAALMAMKHPPLFVFSAAFPALIVMTILSAVLGHAVPTLIPARFTNFAAAILFLVFGAKMLKEGYAISPEEGVTQEMQEVELELAEKEQQARKMGRRRSSSVTPYMLEAGHTNRKSRSGSRLPAVPDSPPSSPGSHSPSPNRGSGSSMSSMVDGVSNLFSLLLSPAWVQTFVMTFLGEWGDRSQIATIAMAAGQDYWWVTGGVLTGHAICLVAAVIGGRAIAGKVSLRVVTLGGAFAFLVFGVIYLAEALYYK